MTKKDTPHKTALVDDASKQYFVLILMVVFFCLTVTFIYNETQPPLYQSTLRLDVQFKEAQPFQKFKAANFYGHQSYLKQYEDLLRDKTLLQKVSQQPQLLNVVRIENEQLSSLNKKANEGQETGPLISKADPELVYLRLKHGLRVHVDPKDGKLAVTVTDSNPKFASVAANLVPQIFVQDQKQIQADLKSAWINMKKEISQAHVSVQKPLAKNAAPATDLIQKKNQLMLEWQQTQHLLNEVSTKLPKSWKNTKLAQIHGQIQNLQNQIKSSSTPDKKKLSQMGFLNIRFKKQLKSKLKELNKELQILKNNPQLTGKMTPKDLIILQAEQDETLFQALLKQDDALFSGQVVISAPASEPQSALTPFKLFNLIVALIIGLILGTMLAMTNSWYQSRIDSEDDIQEKLGLPILGVIPKTK